MQSKNSHVKDIILTLMKLNPILFCQDFLNAVGVFSAYIKVYQEKKV